MKISLLSDANKTNFHMKGFALSLAFIMRFTATRKWPICVDLGNLQSGQRRNFSTRQDVPIITTVMFTINPQIMLQ